MIMVTFSKELNHRPNKQGLFVVFLRITQNRKIKRVKSSVAIRQRDWNPHKQEVRSSNPDHKIFNERLNREIEKLKAAYLNLTDKGAAPTDSIIQKAKEVEASSSFLEYVKKRIDEIFNAGQYRNYKKYNGFYNKLVLFQTKKGKVVDLTFTDITVAYVARFHAFLQSLPNERNPEKMLHPNTIEVVLNIFKTVVKRAVEIDKVIPYSENPFLTYKYHGVKTVKEKLDELEIKSILALNLQPGSLAWHCRNYFMFSFYCAGIRAGDLIQLRWCNISLDGNRISYQMGKNHKDRDLMLVPQAKDILALYWVKDNKPTDYIFPLLDNNASWAKAVTRAEKDIMSPSEKVKLYKNISSKNTLINKELKKIGKAVGLTKNLSFHISRHSFARLAKEKGIDNNHIKSLLAHSSLKITEGYMGCFDTSSNDRALLSVFNSPHNTSSLIEQLKSLSPDELADVINQLQSPNTI